LRDGFRLAREMAEKFWDGLYPVPDEEGVATRVAPLTGLNGDDAEGTLIQPINRIPLTDVSSLGRFDRSHYLQALATAKIPDPTVRDKRIEAGAMSLDKLKKAVDESPAAFFLNLVQDLTASQEEFAKLGAALDAKCGPASPPGSAIRTALADCLAAVKDFARD